MRLTQKTVTVCIATIICGVLISTIFPGFAYNQFHLFGSFLYPAFFTTLVVLAVAGLILDFLIKPRFAFSFTLCLCLFLSAAILTSELVLKVSQKNAIRFAESMIYEIDKYQQKHGYYPKSIDSLQTSASDIKRFKENQNYQLLQDSTFSVWAWNDGWYHYVYYSKNKSWQKIE